MSLPLLAILIAASLTTMLLSPAAYGQQMTLPDSASIYNGQVDDEKKEWIINYMINQIRNMTAPSITIQENGQLHIMDTGGELLPDVNKITSLYTGHPWVPENGYKIDDGKLFAPNGTELFP